jgi:hypothetical protein
MAEGAVWVVGAFGDAASAQSAAEDLRRSGIDPRAISIAGAGAIAPSNEPQREAGFIWRLVVIVVVWSIIGVAIGVVIGIALAAAGVPPGGAFGVLVQAIAWGLFFHIMVGLWAGYALLTSGESRRPVARVGDGRVIVSVRCDADRASVVRAQLASAGARTIATYASDGRLVQ